MKVNFKWKKELFSGTYSIYSNNQLIGTLTDKAFSRTVLGELNGKKYLFNTDGFFKQNTKIIDIKKSKTIGNITYNSWMTGATISVTDKSINWKYDNLWNTRWSLYDKEGTEIKYSGTSTGGQIESNTDDALLLLTGLFVTNYYWQAAIVVIVAIFIPIWTTVLN